MTTELEQEFYDTFGIEPFYRYLLVDTQSRNKKEHLFDKTELIEFCTTHKYFIMLKVVKRYPEITAQKLLEIICIYNEFQNNCDYSFIPTSINNLKGNFLAVIIQAIKDETANRYFCNDVERLKTDIQQLFKN